MKTIQIQLTDDEASRLMSLLAGSLDCDIPGGGLAPTFADSIENWREYRDQYTRWGVDAETLSEWKLDHDAEADLLEKLLAYFPEESEVANA